MLRPALIGGLLGVVLAFVSGCLGVPGNLQLQPTHISCKGKGTLVGTASGFAGINMAIDCGDGLVLDAGPDVVPTVPVK